MQLPLRYRGLAAATLLSAAAASCSPTQAAPPPANQPSQVSGEHTAAAVSGDPVIAAAGDIACDASSGAYNGGRGTADRCRQRAVSDLLVGTGVDAVLPLGDNQYERGSLEDFRRSYDASWGRVLSRTHPVPGNHEYGVSGASGYFSYFGARAGAPSRGYYSYNVGAWHLIALNSECGHIGGCGTGSAQERWLKADLAANRRACTLAYWHRPRFSSGAHGSDASYRVFWNDLYAAGADVVLAGHDHDYERFAPQTPDGRADANRGIREFVVGTGGSRHNDFRTRAANSQVRDSRSFGVLRLTLHPGGYDWKFVSAAGDGFHDSGSARCH